MSSFDAQMEEAFKTGKKKGLTSKEMVAMFKRNFKGCRQVYIASGKSEEVNKMKEYIKKSTLSNKELSIKYAVTERYIRYIKGLI